MSLNTIRVSGQIASLVNEKMLEVSTPTDRGLRLLEASVTQGGSDTPENIEVELARIGAASVASAGTAADVEAVDPDYTVPTGLTALMQPSNGDLVNVFPVGGRRGGSIIGGVHFSKIPEDRPKCAAGDAFALILRSAPSSATPTYNVEMLLEVL